LFEIKIAIWSVRVDPGRSIGLEMFGDNILALDPDSRKRAHLATLCLRARGLVADLAIWALDVFELDLASDDSGVDFVALWTWKWANAKEAAEAILAQTPTSSATQDTLDKEVELKCCGLEGGDKSKKE
jgi:hypothetical protein